MIYEVLRLIRPLSLVLALGLGIIVKCEVRYSSYYVIVIVVSSGVSKSYKSTPTKFVVWPPQCRRGNRAHDVLVENSILQTMESIQEKAQLEHHLRVEKVLGYLQSYLTESLAFVWDSNED